MRSHSLLAEVSRTGKLWYVQPADWTDYVLPSSWWDVLIGLGVFAVSFAVSLATVVWVVLKLPADYFRDPPEHNRPGYQCRQFPDQDCHCPGAKLAGAVAGGCWGDSEPSGHPRSGTADDHSRSDADAISWQNATWKKRFLAQPRILEMLNRIRRRYGHDPLPTAGVSNALDVTAWFRAPTAVLSSVANSINALPGQTLWNVNRRQRLRLVNQRNVSPLHRRTLMSRSIAYLQQSNAQPWWHDRPRRW
jgi:hypothetical protein